MPRQPARSSSASPGKPVLPEPPLSAIDRAAFSLVPRDAPLARPVDMSRVPASVALEIAEGSQDPPVVLRAAGFTEEQVDWLLHHEPFLVQIERFRADLQKNGYTFRSKAAFLAEAHLDTVHALVENKDTPSVVRLDAVKWLAKVGNLEPKENAGALGREGVSITINLGGEKAPLVIEQPPTLRELPA